MRLLRKLGVFLRSKHNLRQAFAIAEINENYAAMIARDIYPAGQCDLSADIALAKRIAVVCAIHAISKSTRHCERSEESRKRLATMGCRKHSLAPCAPKKLRRPSAEQAPRVP